MRFHAAEANGRDDPPEGVPLFNLANGLARHFSARADARRS